MSILGNLIKEQMERSVKLRGQYPPATLVTPLEMLCLREELGMKPDQVLTSLRGSTLIITEFNRFS
jgi:hypothetical protein